jgi:hypothetical protein
MRFLPYEFRLMETSFLRNPAAKSTCALIDDFDEMVRVMVAHLCDSRRGWATGRASPILATDQRRVAHRLCRHHEPGQVHCGSNISV